MHIIQLINQFFTQTKWIEAKFDENEISWIKNWVIETAKYFLQRLIDNNHIEQIESWTTINDYIKYIATTEDPIQTLSDLLK